jgi:hypothetical protein
LINPSTNKLLLEWKKPYCLDISNLLKMLGNVFLLHLYKAFGISLLGWRVDNRVPEAIELLPYLSLLES